MLERMLSWEIKVSLWLKCLLHRFHGGAKDGQKFDSSRDKNKPFKFQIGVGKVIKGWDEGVLKMSLGEKAVLEISWEYGYGANGYSGVIPGKQDLKFEVELLKIN